MNHANGETRGYCRDCIRDMKAGGDLPVCRHADPAADARWCAWCGHPVKA